MDQAVEKYVSRGYGVESRTESQVVMSKKATIGWFWNLLFTIITAGLWLLVVLYRLINRKTYRVVLTIDPDGRLVEIW